MQTLVITPDIQHRQFNVKLPDEFDLNKHIVQILFKNKEKKQEENEIVENEINNYQLFFDAAGDILLDENEVSKFRKMTKIRHLLGISGGKDSV